MQDSNGASFNDIRNWLEVGYYVSQIVIMCLIAFGLRQLHLAKAQIDTTKEIFRTQSRRAATESAVIECRRFADTIVQDMLALEKYCKDNAITYFEVVQVNRSESGFSVNLKNVAEEDIKKLEGATELINRLMNGMEAYALYFLSGIAEEKIAFHSNAKTFIDVAEHMFKLFPVLNLSDSDAGPVRTLYSRWVKKYEATELRVQQKKIERKLSTYSESSIKAIGT